MDNNDIVIINAKVYTIDKEDSIKESIAIKNKKIIYVGNNKDINKYIKKDTKVIDAKGNIILPGMVDSHIHPPGTALTELYEVSLYGLNSIDEYKEAIRIFIDKNPDVKVVYGGGVVFRDF